MIFRERPCHNSAFGINVQHFPKPCGMRAKQFQRFVVCLAIVVVVKWNVLLDPPMWDAAFGLFPAAAELADNGFDLPKLLHQSTYHEGGPNCHAESIVTWITAGVLYTFGKGQLAFVVLHLLTFAATAWTLTVLFSLTADCYGRREAWLVCLALLACPLFSVQAGAMYFEMPLAACAITALAAYSNGQLKRAIGWSILAVLVKQAGIVVPGALIAAILLRSGPLGKRLGLAVAISVPAFLAAIAPLLGTRLLDSYSKPPEFHSWWLFMTHQHLPYLRAIPDILVAYALYLVCSLLLAGRVWSALRHDGTVATSTTSTAVSDATTEVVGVNQSRTSDRRASQLLSVGFLQMLAFAGFFFFVPYVGRLEIYCLPRYFVFLLPMLFFGLVHFAVTTSRPLASVGLMMVTVWFVANRDGAWYPLMQPNNGAIAERAESCRWLAENQRIIVNAASRLPVDSLVLYGLPEHYFLNHPWMGYATRIHPGGRCVTFAAERPASLKVADLPDRFYIILDSMILGGRDLRAVLREAGDDPTRQVRVIDESGRSPFSVKLYEVTRNPEMRISSRQ